jgi:transposase
VGDDLLTSNNQNLRKFRFVCIEDLVPKDHLLRKIDKYIDFSFIHEKVSQYYCKDNGRPSIDKVVLFKMIFIDYLYGEKLERQ